MPLSTELSDDTQQDLSHLVYYPRRRMVDGHIDNEAASEPGVRQGYRGQSSAFLLGMDRAASKDCQPEARANCCLSTRHTFDLAHDIELSTEYQGLPLEQNTDTMTACGQDQRQGKCLFHCQRGIGCELSGRADRVEHFFEEWYRCRLGDTIQRDGKIVDTRIHRCPERLAITFADRQADLRKPFSAFLNDWNGKRRAN
jgi:hypothetical protein